MPFEFLKRKKTGELFEADVVRNWYKARVYVIDKLKGFAFLPNEKRHLHVVVMDVDDKDARPLMLSVVRQVALSAHYINYKEDAADDLEKNRTLITIVSNNEDEIIEELRKEEYLFLLPDYGKDFFKGGNKEHKDGCPNVEVDLELKIDVRKPDDANVVMTREDVNGYLNKEENKIYEIDTRKALLADRMYKIGSDIDNLPYEHIHDTERYSVALNVFQNKKMPDKDEKLIQSEWKDNQIKVLEGISNIICSDCFESRERSVKKYFNKLEKAAKEEKKIKKEKDAWQALITELSKSEHARWIVEKLIFGYRPLNTEQRYKYESLFGNKRKEYANELKRSKEIDSLAHIDLCSYADLRRIDPDNMKYDSFLMLGIPGILKYVGKNA